eukprot:m51a1_g4463 putative protein serine threonine kinase (1324) ;mRNA; r:198200-204112
MPLELPLLCAPDCVLRDPSVPYAAPGPVAATSVLLCRRPAAGSAPTHVLLSRRAPGLGACPATWSFPGGHLRKGESMEEAVVRQARDEVGLGVAPGSLRPLSAFEAAWAPGPAVSAHYVIVTYAADAAAEPAGVSLRADEADAAVWVPVAALGRLAEAREDVELPGVALGERGAPEQRTLRVAAGGLASTACRPGAVTCGVLVTLRLWMQQHGCGPVSRSPLGGGEIVRSPPLAPMEEKYRLKCYLGEDDIRIVNVPLRCSAAEVLQRLADVFDRPVCITHYEDVEKERVKVGPDFWGSEAQLVYRHLRSQSKGPDELVSLKLWLRSAPTAAAAAAAAPEQQQQQHEDLVWQLSQSVPSFGSAPAHLAAAAAGPASMGAPQMAAASPLAPRSARPTCPLPTPPALSEEEPGDESSSEMSGSDDDAPPFRGSDPKRTPPQSPGVGPHGRLLVADDPETLRPFRTPPRTPSPASDDVDSPADALRQQDGRVTPPVLSLEHRRTPPPSPPLGQQRQQQQQQQAARRMSGKYDDHAMAVKLRLQCVLSSSCVTLSTATQQQRGPERDAAPDGNDVDGSAGEEGEEERQQRERERHEQELRNAKVIGEAAEALTRKHQRTTTPRVWVRADKIGQGGFGTVYQGLNKETGDIFAVKQVELDESGDERARRLLEQYDAEIQLMKNLDHPNIVQSLGAEIRGSTLNIFMEYVGGGSLSLLLKKFGPFGESVIRVYTRQILQGLHYLHSNNILHRDVKCANILLDTAIGSKSNVKLTDFGCSRKLADSLGNAPHSVKGTPYFMAPEVLMAQKYGSAADIWSLGCTVIEMATARPPMSSVFPEAHAAMFHIIQPGNSITIPAHLSPQLQSLISSCLEKDPSLRPTALQLLNHPFFNTATPERAQGSPKLRRSPTAPPSFVSLDRPPSSVLRCVAPYVDLGDVRAMTAVCRGWRDALADDRVWESLCNEYFQPSEEASRSAFAFLLGRRREWAAEPASAHFKGHEKAITDCRCISLYGKKLRVITASEDKKVKVWNVRKGRCSHTLKHTGGVNAVAIRDKATLPLVYTGCDDGVVRVWSPQKYKCLHSTQLANSVLALEADDRRLVAAVRGSPAVVLDVSTNEQLLSFADDPPALAVHGNETVYCAAYSNGTVSLLDTRSGKIDRQLCHRSAVTSVQMCTTGNLLVTGSTDGTVCRWDMRRMGSPLRSFDHGAPVARVWFSDSLLASCGGDRSIKLWDSHTSACHRALLGPHEGLSCVHGCGRVIAAGGSDKLLHVWCCSPSVLASGGSGSGSGGAGGGCGSQVDAPPAPKVGTMRKLRMSLPGLPGFGDRPRS